jgi:16S rRNA (adenine1518-N6/adenine1519-N6)-dimethyltransferase
MIKAKKSLGQNFLTSVRAVNDIVSAGNVAQGDLVLEIGPGEGVLTEKLLAAGATVIAIEKDDRLIITLNQRFSSEIKTGRFILIHGDVLDLVQKNSISPNLSKLLGKKLGNYKLIANIPYYITGEIIERFHTTPCNPGLMVLLVQKEVAERILARDSKQSILSVAVKMYGTPKLVSIVPRGAFRPAPNVDSAVLSINDVKHFGKPDSEKDFFDLLHASFSHKRKLMLSNIKILPEKVQNKVRQVFEKNNLGINTRAEDIAIDVWRTMV